jgi:hypothetical protein
VIVVEEAILVEITTTMVVMTWSDIGNLASAIAYAKRRRSEMR